MAPPDMAPVLRLLLAVTLLLRIGAGAPRDAVTVACVGDTPSNGRAFVQLASVQRSLAGGAAVTVAEESSTAPGAAAERMLIDLEAAAGSSAKATDAAETPAAVAAQSSTRTVGLSDEAAARGAPDLALAAERNASPSVEAGAEAAAGGTVESSRDRAVADEGGAPNGTGKPMAKVEAVGNETFGLRLHSALLRHGPSAVLLMLRRSVASQGGSVAAIVALIATAVMLMIFFLVFILLGGAMSELLRPSGDSRRLQQQQPYGQGQGGYGPGHGHFRERSEPIQAPPPKSHGQRALCPMPFSEPSELSEPWHVPPPKFHGHGGHAGYGPEKGPYSELSEPTMPAPSPRFHGNGGQAGYETAPKQEFTSPAMLSRGSDIGSVTSGHSPEPGSMPHFCAELVVPKDCEAMLVVPAAAPTKQHGSQQLKIRDLEGNPVVHAEVSPQASGRDPVVLLASKAPPGGGRLEQKTLASCYILSGSRGRTVEVFNGAGERFAVLERSTAGAALPVQAQYKLTPVQPSGAYLRPYLLFRGVFEEHKVGVWDERQTVKVADTEGTAMRFDEGGRFYKLRVSADGDVGLVLCALLAIEVLESRS